MTARLIWITPDAEKIIAYCARVSNPKNQDNPDASRLLRYCAKHKHWSVFEMASMCVEVTTTRDISAQILRHRSFSFQEWSSRYSSMSELGTAHSPDLRLQDKSNRQNSLCPDEDDYALMCELAQFESEIEDLFEASGDLYQRLLEAGVAKECARKVLPLNTPTRLYMSGTIRSWIHYLQIRTGKETQLEHRRIAEEVKAILKDNLPNTYGAMFEPPTLPPIPTCSTSTPSSPLRRFFSSLVEGLRF